VVGTVKVDASGLWSLTTTPFADGRNYSIYATATDAANNTSVKSESLSFHIDGNAPMMPTGTVAIEPGANQVLFTGTAEPGSLVQLVRITDATEIARGTATADGYWRIESAPLPDGEYTISTVSVDLADNATSSPERMVFTVSSTLNMTGNAQADIFTPGVGNNAIDGNDGLDVVRYMGARENFTVTKGVYGHLVQDKSGNLGRDTLVDIERVQFQDNKWLALDVDGVAGQVYRLYQAAFDRVPDAGGFSYWLNAMDKGYTLSQIASLFLPQKEFIDMYMSDPSDANFVTKLYAHVLHRAPDEAGLQWWLENVNRASRAEVLVMFSESPENQAQVIGSIQHGIEYTPYSG